MFIQHLPKRLFAALLGLCFIAPDTHAQQGAKERHYLLSVFNTATQLPIGDFFSTPLHLGATAGAEFRYNRHPENHWLQTAKLGYAYHQYVQHTIQLYSEFGYRRAIWRGTAAEFRLGAGYLHAIPAAEIFSLNDRAYQKKTNLGRPQFMTGATLGLSYTQQKSAHPLRFFAEYQFYLQMPFVKSYVPLLPNTLFHLGVGVPFSTFKKN